MSRFWSVSRNCWVQMAEAPHQHLVNAHSKFLRGHYQVPVDEDDPLVMRPLTDAETAQMRADFESELARRIAAGGGA